MDKIKNKLRLDITGMTFGKLYVIEPIGVKKNQGVIWRCICSCSNQNEVFAGTGSLTSGHTNSCGCYKIDRTKETNTKHGKRNTSENKAWKEMKERCYNPNNSSYHRYGGRGIIVCEEWKNSFEKFYLDMGDKPGKEYSIERINNDGNYEPGNCRWATRKEQSRNRRSNKNIEFNGEIKILTEWAELIGISPSLISQRIRNNWTMDQIFGYEPRNGKYYYPPNLIGSGLLKSW